MQSKVHPKYKTTYRVGNWREYERALVQRGDVTLWLSAAATDAWRPSPSGRPGGQKRFSAAALMVVRTTSGGLINSERRKHPISGGKRCRR